MAMVQDVLGLEITAFDITAFDITDDELAAEALAADPDTPLPDDAVAFSADGESADLLPGWYMPAPAAVGGRLLHGWRRRVVLLVIASFLLINAYGLCSTYGHVGFG